MIGIHPLPAAPLKSSALARSPSKTSPLAAPPRQAGRSPGGFEYSGHCVAGSHWHLERTILDVTAIYSDPHLVPGKLQYLLFEQHC